MIQFYYLLLVCLYVILTPWYYLLVGNSIIFGYGWHVGSPQEQLTLLQKPRAPMSDDLAMSLKQDFRINQGASLLLSSRFKWPHLLYSYYLKRNHMCDCSMFFYSMITILRCTHHLVFELSDQTPSSLLPLTFTFKPSNPRGGTP